MKSKTREKLEDILRNRESGFLCEEGGKAHPKQLTHEEALHELEALIEREREVAKIAVDNIRAKIDNFRRETIDENRAITMGSIVDLINEIDWKVKELESYLQSIKKEGGE